MRSLHSIRAALRRAGRRRAARRVGPAAAGAAAAAGRRRDELHDLPARRADRQRADRASRRSADGWTIVSSGRLGAPLDIVARRLQVRYTPDWRPLELTLDATVRGQPQTHSHHASRGRPRRAQIDIAGQATREDRHHRPDALLLLPNSFFAPYEALAARLRTAARRHRRFRSTSVPQTSITHPRRRVVRRADSDHGASGQRATHARRRSMPPGAQLDADIWTDEPAG